MKVLWLRRRSEISVVVTNTDSPAITVDENGKVWVPFTDKLTGRRVQLSNGVWPIGRGISKSITGKFLHFIISPKILFLREREWRQKLVLPVADFDTGDERRAKHGSIVDARGQVLILLDTMSTTREPGIVTRIYRRFRDIICGGWKSRHDTIDIDDYQGAEHVLIHEVLPQFRPRCAASFPEVVSSANIISITQLFHASSAVWDGKYLEGRMTISDGPEDALIYSHKDVHEMVYNAHGNHKWAGINPLEIADAFAISYKAMLLSIVKGVPHNHFYSVSDAVTGHGIDYSGQRVDWAGQTLPNQRSRSSRKSAQRTEHQIIEQEAMDRLNWDMARMRTSEPSRSSGNDRGGETFTTELRTPEHISSSSSSHRSHSQEEPSSSRTSRITVDSETVVSDARTGKIIGVRRKHTFCRRGIARRGCPITAGPGKGPAGPSAPKSPAAPLAPANKAPQVHDGTAQKTRPQSKPVSVPVIAGAG